MKYTSASVSVLVVLSVLVSLGHAGTFLSTEISAGAMETIYRNMSADSINVTVQAINTCQGLSGSFKLKLKDAEKVVLDVVRVQRGEIRTFTFAVPGAGGIIVGDCLPNGCEVGPNTPCIYMISVP